MTTKAVIVYRQQARGDVLLCTPIVKALKRKYPDSRIYFVTDYPEILRRNPNVDRCMPTGWRPYSGGNAIIVNLEVAYETMPRTHLIDAFAIGAGMQPNEYEKKLEFFPALADNIWATQALTPFLKFPRVVINPGPGAWPGRNWCPSRWQLVINELQAHGVKVILVGHGKSYIGLVADLDLRNRTTFHQLGAICAQAHAFAGIDSFPAHVAGAVGCPRVILFGITRGRYILCDSSRSIAVESPEDHPYSGARHCVRKISSVRLGNPPKNPMDEIQPIIVYEAIKQLLDSNVGKPYELRQ